MAQCEIWGCDGEGEYIDDSGDIYCEECMIEYVEKGGMVYEDFETYTSNHEFG